ncbi:MAG: acyl-ACP desaturase [Acidimicrobiaceae bacterium]|jgi:acyl-[acyl-carrier-protein] desaturase|nr:acyl-ACP desaturase [Ilumatobacteraceae bacterium]
MDDLALLSELEPEAERLLNRHLESAEDWYPHDYVPWDRAQRLLTDGFSYGESELPEGVRSALLVNLLTEDNLPWYTRTISRMFGGESAWGTWAQRWTAEEGRHAIVMRDYITVSGLVEPRELEDGRMAQVSSAIVPEPESAADGMCYVAVQELATRISHRNTGTMLDKTGYDVMMKLSTDENRHHLFYRDMVTKLLELNPSLAVEALERQIVNFAMPGVGIPGFAEHSKAIAQAGIYDFAIHHEKIIMPLVFRQWAIDKVEGLSANAEKARDNLMRHIERVGKVAKRQAERRAAAEAAVVA